MPKNKMSYGTAHKIIDIYSELLMNLSKLEKYEKYAYSDLKGYDLIDISNALKLTAAFRLYNIYELNDKEIEKLKWYAQEDSSGLLQFFFHFFPDNVASELKKLDHNNEMAILDSIKLTKDSQSEIQQLFNKEETPDSFLNYCISVGRFDPNYWGKIYERIGIRWETNDNKDLIYVLIRLGINYQSKENLLKDQTEPSTETIAPKTSKNIFKRLKEKLFN
jgi:hypothetical protein